MLARAGYWLVQFLALLGLWFLFVDQLKLSELLVGLGASALAATAAEAVRGQEHPHFLPDLGQLKEAWRLPGRILTDTWLVTLKLVRRGPSTGSFHALPFDARGNDGRAVARRALAILYSTLPPNSIVIGIDRKRNEMLVHTLEGV